jgi:hypothetical protein
MGRGKRRKGKESSVYRVGKNGIYRKTKFLSISWVETGLPGEKSLQAKKPHYSRLWTNERRKCESEAEKQGQTLL